MSVFTDDLTEVEQAILDTLLCRHMNNENFVSAEQELLHMTRIMHLAAKLGGNLNFCVSHVPYGYFLYLHLPGGSCQYRLDDFGQLKKEPYLVIEDTSLIS